MVWPFSRGGGGEKRKIWKINNHRIKKVVTKKTVGYKMVPDPPPTGSRSRKPQKEKVTYYECVDCEKTHDDRDSFKEEECYDVIYE